MIVPPAVILETPRLMLRRFSLDDERFIFAMLNDPDWIRNIGNRNINTLEDAREYIRAKVLAMYERAGFGMYAVLLKGARDPIGMCGLVRREGLEDVDIGFAFLPEFRGRGFAAEAAAAILDHARKDLGLSRIVAIVAPDNGHSIRVLERIGLRFERMMKLPGDNEEIALYATQAAA